MSPTANENGAEMPRILVVEDEILVALAIAGGLEEGGYALLGPAASIDDALALIRSDPPDAALLDVNLGGIRITPVAEALVGLGIPFATVTGYVRLALAEPILQNAPRLRKPFSDEEIASTVARLLA